MKMLLKKTLAWGACALAISTNQIVAAPCVTSSGDISLWLPLDGSADDLVTSQAGTLIGSPAFGAGKVGQGLSFDGTDDAIRLSASSAVDIGDSSSGLTIELWVNPQTIDPPLTMLEWSGENGSQLGLHFVTSVLGSGTLFANLIDINGQSHHIVSAGGVLAAGGFQHVALTYDRSSGMARIFRNGAQVAQANFGNLRLETRAGLWIGKRVAGGGNHYLFAGTMDEVSLYTRALSQTELQAIFEAGESGKCKTPVAPSIVVQPASQTILKGESASFSVSATGTAPLSYQWWFQGLPVAGATNAAYSIINAGTNNSGAYEVVVQNAVGAVTSVVATLTVNLQAPQITAQPVNQTVLVGTGASFSVSATGTPTLTYQWLFGGQLMAGETNPTLTISATTTNDAGEYSVIVENDAGSVTSQVATLTVNLPPPCLSVPAGVAGWWPFDGDGTDLVGGGGAALSGEPAFVSGKVGSALQFDGGNDAASVPGNPQLNIGAAPDGFTIEGWIKPDSINQQALLEWNNRAGLAGVHFWLGQSPPLGGGAGCLYVNLVDVSNLSHRMTTAGGVVSVGSWQHVALTYNKASGLTAIYVNGASVAEQVLGTFTAQTGPTFDLLFGHRIFGGIQSPYHGAMDEMSVYARPLTAAEIQSIVGTGASGKCNNGFPPQIVSGPQNQTVVRGSTVTFTVGASGTAPLAYQWFFNETPIEGATASTLALENVQLNQGGNYSVTVSNELGTATSGSAVLVVNHPPAIVRVVNANGAGAAEVTVPIELVANGNENALGFSLGFNANVLSFVSANLGVGAPSGAALLVNTNDVSAGRLGIAVGLPADEVFPEGTQQVALVTFLVAPILNQTVTPVSFGNQPTLRQVVDTQARVLNATFVNGTVSISDSQFEADVAPRPNGDRSLATIDWVQMGRLVARLDAISSPNEFQRADCAPRSTKGNGLLTVSDWVQAGRYAVGLDPLTVLGGPTEEETGGGGGFAAASANGRQLCLVNSNIAQGQTNVVPVTLECQGNENAASFSVVFDPATIKFIGATPGTGASGGLLNLNTAEVSEGRLGVALATQPGTTFPAGMREMLQIKFSALVSAPATTSVSFGNSPVPREVSDAAANPLPTDYTAGSVSITPPPGPPLRVTRTGNSLFITWPSSATGFELEGTAGALGTAWSAVPGVVDLGEQKLAIVPVGTGERYFRLRKP